MRLCLIILFFLPMFAIAQTDTTGPQFTFTDVRYHDFDGIPLNANAEHSFEFKNTGNRPLIIKEMHGSVKGLNSPPYKVIINYPQYPIKPGKKGMITITIVAQGNIGSFKNEILITSNATPANFPLLLITGAIIPEQGKITPKQTEPIIPVEFLVPVIQAISK